MVSPPTPSRSPDLFPAPLIILAPPLTFSWAVCAMLGEHPEMHGLPELHLFSAPTMADLLAQCERADYDMDHGLVRAVAQLFFAGQNEDAASRARGWLRRRAHLTTGLVAELLLARLAPLVAVEKSPSLVLNPAALARGREMFPRARFLHLVSHPRLYGERVVTSLQRASRTRDLPATHWLVRLARGRPAKSETAQPDPQFSWLSAHQAILDFLSEVPAAQQRRTRGEDLLDPQGGELAGIAGWLRLRDDPAALEAMRHPERSPYVRHGPPSARFGSDVFVHEQPLVPEDWHRPRSLDGPLSWRQVKRGFTPEVVELAHWFGYA